MVLGLTRPRLRSASTDLTSLDAPESATHSWHSERGEILFETACDVIGGFPGYATVGGRLCGHRLRITERYLLVGDGHQQGFGLPIRQLDGSAFIPVEEDEDFALRLFYRDGFASRLFTIQFQGMRLPSRGGLRAERAQLLSSEPDSTTATATRPRAHRTIQSPGRKPPRSNLRM